MNTEEVEKVLGRKFIPGKSLQEQCTPEEWDEICRLSEIEVEIITEKHMVSRTETDEQIEKRVKAKHRKDADGKGND